MTRDAFTMLYSRCFTNVVSAFAAETVLKFDEVIDACICEFKIMRAGKPGKCVKERTQRGSVSCGSGWGRYLVCRFN